MLLISTWYLLMNSAYNNADKGVDVHEKTPEELKRERDRKRYANMSAEAKKEKISKKHLSQPPNNNIRSIDLNDEGNYVYIRSFIVFTTELSYFLLDTMVAL